MDKIKRKKIELAGAHRACEFYGLNEGIDNHITTKDMIHMGFYVVWWLWWSLNSKWLISGFIPKKSEKFEFLELFFTIFVNVKNWPNAWNFENDCPIFLWNCKKYRISEWDI